MVGKEILERIVWREALSDPVMPGYSGALLERARLDDGSPVVIKHISPETDLGMQASRDDGRAVQLWWSGYLGGPPPGVDAAILAAWKEGSENIVVMRDVSEWLLPEERRLTREENRRVLKSVASFHGAFEGRGHPSLCTIETHVTMLSPVVVGALESEAPIVKQIKAGWQAFQRLVPESIAAAVMSIHAQPGPLAEAMRRRGSTLVHGDLWFSNLGLTPNGIVVLDWSLAVEAPGAFDLALYLLGNAHAIDATKEEVIADYKAVGGADFHEDVAELSFLAAFVEYGWLVAQSVADGWAPEDELRWWQEKASQGLNRLGS